VLATEPQCAGDCDQDGVVNIQELILGAGILLGRTEIADCSSFDLDLDGQITVDELLVALLG
jgi:Ca2+-binding EF-hand superfamily protein